MAVVGEAGLRHPILCKDLHLLVLLREGGAAWPMGTSLLFTVMGPLGFLLPGVPFPFPVRSPTLAAGAPESALPGWRQGGGCRGEAYV